jgi:hypothetical protein
MAAVDKSITAQFSQLQQTVTPVSVGEGVWTPILSSSTGDLNFTVTQQVGYYQKIQNVVHINFVMKCQSHITNGESGNLLVRGLPFPVVSDFANTIPCAIGAAHSTTDNVEIVAAWSPGSALRLIHNNNFVQVGVVGNGSNFDLVGSLTYFTTEL